MMAEEKQIMPKRHLDLQGIQEEKSYGDRGKTLLPIKAIDLDLPEEHAAAGKAIKFVAFNPVLVQWLKELAAGPEHYFLADYEIRQRDANYGPDLTIVQIYDASGAPVSQKSSGRGGGYSRSPEVIRLEYQLKAELEATERRSVEGVAGIQEIGRLMTSTAAGAPLEGCGVDMEMFDRLQAKYWQAVEQMVDNYLDKPVPQTSQGTTQSPQNRKSATTSKEAVSKHPEKEPDSSGEAAEAMIVRTTVGDIKHVGDLLTCAMRLKPPVKREEVMQIMNINDPKEITDLAGAWETIIKYHQSRPKSQKDIVESADTTTEAWSALHR